MAEDKILSFDMAPPITDRNPRLQAIALLYHQYAATKDPMPNTAGDTAIRFAEYVLGHPEELAEMLREVFRRTGANSQP